MELLPCPPPPSGTHSFRYVTHINMYSPTPHTSTHIFSTITLTLLGGHTSQSCSSFNPTLSSLPLSLYFSTPLLLACLYRILHPTYTLLQPSRKLPVTGIALSVGHGTLLWRHTTHKFNTLSPEGRVSPWRRPIHHRRHSRSYAHSPMV